MINPLPVKFTSLKVNVDSKICKIEWNVEQQINNKMFVLEKSGDGRTFDSVGHVQPNTTGYYYAYDQIGTCAYYRVKQVDFDGRYSFSKIVFASVMISGISLTPNPFKNELNLSLYVKTKSMYSVAIRNMVGSMVASRQLFLNNGANFVKINTDTIQPGVYVVTVRNESAVVLSQKIIK